jgi:hypothetical protein
MFGLQDIISILGLLVCASFLTGTVFLICAPGILGDIIDNFPPGTFPRIEYLLSLRLGRRGP